MGPYVVKQFRGGRSRSIPLELVRLLEPRAVGPQFRTREPLQIDAPVAPNTEHEMRFRVADLVRFLSCLRSVLSGYCILVQSAPNFGHERAFNL